MGCPGSEKGDVVMKKVKIILQQDVNYLLSRYEKKGELKSEFKNITIPKGFSYYENCIITPFVDEPDRATMCLVNHCANCNCEVIKQIEVGKWRPCITHGLRDVRIVKKFLNETLSVEEKIIDSRWEDWKPYYSKASDVIIEEPVNFAEK